MNSHPYVTVPLRRNGTFGKTSHLAHTVGKIFTYREKIFCQQPIEFYKKKGKFAIK